VNEEEVDGRNIDRFSGAVLGVLGWDNGDNIKNYKTQMSTIIVRPLC
jgi:hypothetical protein